LKNRKPVEILKIQYSYLASAVRLKFFKIV
jgi:hypothetical protein